MKKSVRVSDKLVNPGLSGLQVATRLTVVHIEKNDSCFLVGKYKYIYKNLLGFTCIINIIIVKS